MRLAEIVFDFEALSAEHNDGYLERGQLHGLSGTVTILGCMGLRSLSCHCLLTCHYLCLMNTRSECTFGDASKTQKHARLKCPPVARPKLNVDGS